MKFTHTVLYDTSVTMICACVHVYVLCVRVRVCVCARACLYIHLHADFDPQVRSDGESDGVAPCLCPACLGLRFPRHQLNHVTLYYNLIYDTSLYSTVLVM